MLTTMKIPVQGLSRIEVQGCSKLTSVAIWADALTSLDMSDCLSLVSVDLYCPNLAEENLVIPPAPAPHYSTQSVPVRGLVALQYREKSIQEERESDRHISILESIPQRIAHRF